MVIWITAFIGGITSFLSPCFFPLIPSYLGYVAGAERQGRLKILKNALGFVLGFGVVFTFFGAGVGLLGESLTPHLTTIQKVSAIFLIVFGLLLLEIFPLSFLIREFRLPFPKHTRHGIVSSFAVGLGFAFGWTPCIGPILGTILTLAYTFTDWQQSTLLLAVYSAGLAIPFLFCAAALETVFLPFKKHLAKIGVWLQRFSGLVLIAFGVILFTDNFPRLIQLLL